MAVRIVVTMNGAWGRPVEIIEPIGPRLKFLSRLLKAARDADAVVLRGTSGFSERYVEIIAAILIKLRSRWRPVVLISDASWDLTSDALEGRLGFIPGISRALPALSRLVVRALDGPHVLYGVLSTDEQREFSKRWGADAQRVYFTPFFASVEVPDGGTPSDQGYVLSVGKTNRNFEILAEAAEGLPVPVRIASTWEPSKPLPPNVSTEWLSPPEYSRLMLGASALVVPIKASARSVAQQTYLSGMMFGKPTIVTEAPGVHDYITNGENGLIVENDPAALRKAIEWVLNPSNREAVAAMGANAQQTVREHFLPRHYWGLLADIVTERVRERGPEKGAALS